MILLFFAYCIFDIWLNKRSGKKEKNKHTFIWTRAFFPSLVSSVKNVQATETESMVMLDSLFIKYRYAVTLISLKNTLTSLKIQRVD